MDDTQGKMPKPQSFAAAMSVASRRKKKYAKGGMAEDTPMGQIKQATIARPDAGFGAIVAKAKGGMVDDESEEEQHASMVAAIMARREHDKMMAEGGMVDLDENEEEQPREYNDLDEAALKENYDDDVDEPMDSNEHGDDIMANRHDRVSAIRRKMKMRP